MRPHPSVLSTDILKEFTVSMSDSSWRDCALPGIRSILAEGVAAEVAEKESPGEAIWAGGNTKSFDIQTSTQRFDAKSVQVRNGYVILARRNAEPFKADKVDRIVLVHLDAHTGYRIDLTAGTAAVTGEATILDLWDVPVTDLNALMRPHDPAVDVQWRNVEIPVEALEAYRLR